jgi:hypothetical protein
MVPEYLGTVESPEYSEIDMQRSKSRKKDDTVFSSQDSRRAQTGGEIYRDMSR